MLWRLWAIWDVTGHDPYRVFNSLDDEYRPVEGGGPSFPPPYPDRVQSVIYAFARFSQERKEDLAGAKRTPQRRRRKQG